MGFLTKRYCFKRWEKRFAAFCFDCLGYLLFFPFQLFRPSFDSNQIRRILVIRLDQIGDVIMTRPAIASLNKHFPQAVVDLLVSQEVKPLLENETGIHEVIGIDHSWLGKQNRPKEEFQEARRITAYLKEKKYDLAVDFRGDIRNILLMSFANIPRRLGYSQTGGGFLLSRETEYPLDQHQVDMNLRLLECLNVKKETEMPRFAYPGERKGKFKNRFPELFIPGGASPKIVVHPAAGYPSKKWPETKFRQLIEKIIKEELGLVIIIGTEQDKQDFSEIQTLKGKLMDLRGETRLEDLPVLFDQCDIYIGNDSGPAHLAAAQGIEVISIFSGANNVRLWHPWTKRLELVTHSVSCSPCESQECPLKHHDCMEKITVEQVYAVLKEKVEGRRKIMEKRK